MRSPGALATVLFLSIAAMAAPRAVAEDAVVPSPQDDASAPAPQPQEPAEPPPPVPQEGPADPSTSVAPEPGEDSDSPPAAKPAPPVPATPGRRAATVPAVRPAERKRPPPPDPAEPKLPEDTPPPSNNELAAQVGWNSDTPFGLRYLRRVEGTPVSFGLGLGLVTMWGPKLSAIVRLQTGFEQGFFAQASAGYTLGGAFVEDVAVAGSEPQQAHLVRTPSRTADVVVGWRLPLAANFLEASAGWSFNLQGTVLQQQVVDGHANRPMLAFDLNRVPFNRAGGFAGAVSYGWLF